MLQLHPLFVKLVGLRRSFVRRLRVHGVIKKVGKSYKYYLTDFGREVAAMALKLREMVVIPDLAFGVNSPA
jgi:hypothetical protein